MTHIEFKLFQLNRNLAMDLGISKILFLCQKKEKGCDNEWQNREL